MDDNEISVKFQQIDERFTTTLTKMRDAFLKLEQLRLGLERLVEASGALHEKLRRLEAKQAEESEDVEGAG